MTELYSVINHLIHGIDHSGEERLDVVFCWNMHFEFKRKCLKTCLFFIQKEKCIGVWVQCSRI